MVCNSVTDREAWELRAFLYTTEFKEDISNNGNCIKWVKPRLRDPDNGHITSNWCQIFKIVGRRIDNFDINLTKEKNIRFVLFCSNSKYLFSSFENLKYHRPLSMNWIGAKLRSQHERSYIWVFSLVGFQFTNSSLFYIIPQQMSI